MGGQISARRDRRQDVVLVDGSHVVVAGLLLAIAALNAVASRLTIPYPIVLVVGGLVSGWFATSAGGSTIR
jgi:hypothetical protein